MTELQIHADRSQPALVHGGSLPWVPSPEPGVERRMLERIGGEVAVASTIVRYRAGSRFPTHQHAWGEEFIVLEGTFSDEMGHYPAGTYVRNPPGSSHAPFSTEGCIIFVKLRQMGAGESQTVRMFPDALHWAATGSPKREQAPLYSNGRIESTLVRLKPGGDWPGRNVDGGEEGLVLEGKVTRQGNDPVELSPWSWWRQPGSRQPALSSEQGALLWIKRGHLR